MWLISIQFEHILSYSFK